MEYKIITLKKIITIVCGVLSSIVLARYLGAEERASYAVIVNAAAILVVFLNFGVNSAYQKVRRDKGMAATRLFYFYTIYSAATFLLLLLLVTTLTSVTYFFISLVAIGSLFRMQLQTYCLVEDIRGSSVAVIVGSFLEFLALLALWVFTSSNAQVAILALLSKELFVSLLTIFYLKHNQELSLSGVLKIKEVFFKARGGFFYYLKKVLQTPLFFLLSILIVINYKADVLLLAYFEVPKISIGVFAVGVLLADYLWIFSDIFKDVQISKSSKGSGASDAAAATRYALFITFFVYLAFFLLGKNAVALLYGDEFSDSYYIALLMLFANVFMIPCKIIGTYFISLGRVRDYVYSMFFAVVINIFVGCLLIPYFGVYGAVLASFLAYFVSAFFIITPFLRSSGLRISDVLFINKQELTFVVQWVLSVFTKARRLKWFNFSG